MSGEEVVKRKPGRPRKSPLAAQGAGPAESRPSPHLKMKAKPNWETMEPGGEETPDRLRIPPDMVPDGMSALWVTDSVYGQAMPQHRADFERKGWTPIHQSDFDGRFDGMFMPKGRDGEITVDGLVLMMRPKEITEKARRQESRRAREQIAIKENALRGGDLPVSLDSRHVSAINTNRIVKSVERIEVPKD